MQAVDRGESAAGALVAVIDDQRRQYEAEPHEHCHRQPVADAEAKHHSEGATGPEPSVPQDRNAEKVHEDDHSHEHHDHGDTP